jgi:four helix bundle protein
MAAITRFEEIEAWKTARTLTNRIYSLSDKGTFSHDFGLRDQMRRAAVSIMSNIAEGFESRTQALFIEFLGRAKGSAGELRCQCYIALDHQYITKDEFDELYNLADKCSSQIYRFMEYLKTQPNARHIREETSSYELEPSTGGPSTNV